MNAARANVVNKTDGLQPVGYRAFEPGQVKLYPGIAQLLIKRFQSFQCTGIDIVHRDADEHQVFQLRLVGYHLQHDIFQVFGVGKVEALIHPDSSRLRPGFYLVPRHVAIRFCVANAADLCHMGST